MQSGQRLLPGITRVAPVSSVKSAPPQNQWAYGGVGLDLCFDGPVGGPFDIGPVITPDPAAFDACVMYLEDLGCVF